MGEQMEKRFTWVLKKFSSLQDEKCYSPPFAAAGCNWRLVAYRKGDKYDGDLCVYLDLAFLPSGWRREVKFSLTIVNKGWCKSDLGLGGQCFFDAENKSWGYDTFVSLTKLNAKGERFVVNNKLIILAELHIFPAVVVPEETVNNQFNALEDASNTVGNHGIKSNSLAAETEVSNDDAPKEDVNDEASSLVSNDNARNGTSLDQVKSLEDASQTVENVDRGFNTVASITETANNLLTEEVQPAKETIGVNEFDVFSAQMEKRLTWVLKKFCSLQDEVYSHPFTAAGCNWRLAAHPKGEKNGGYLSVYLELADPSSLPSGWRREVKFSLTVVNQACAKSNIRLRAKCFFDAENDGWGCNELVSLTKLHAKDEGFVVNNKLVILAELHVSPAVVVPEETVNITEPLSSKDGIQAAAAADPSEEGTDINGSFEEDVDSDDTSSPLSDDGGGDVSLFNQPNALEDASNTVGNHDIKSNSRTAETDVSNDNAPNEDVDDEASSLVSNDSSRNGTSLDQVKSLEDASQTVENSDRGFNTVASITETANNLLTEEVQPAKETMHVNGFDLFSSQVESVSHIFERHPDIALSFRPKNQQIRRAYMNELLNLIEMLCQLPEKLSEDDLSNADDTLADLIDVGFKLDWLKTKLKEVSEKKKQEQSSGARLRTMEEQLQKLKLMFLDLETQLQMEKTVALAARAPLSFNDVVC